MRKKSELTVSEMAEYADWYFNRYFNTNIEAAEYFKTNSPTISQVRKGKQPPNDLMLGAFGYTKERIYKKVQK